MSFTTKKECYESKFKKVQTNSRYSHFKQQHYTVGDEDQFDECIHETTMIKGSSCILPIKNLFHELKMEFWMGYKYQEHINVINTFRYIFYKFKKGIFVRIENKEVKLFLPMSNANFINEWSDLISRNFEVFKKVSVLDGRPYVERNINKYVRNWYSNNCLVRYEYPINESDTNVSNIHDFFFELCKNRDIPDIEFFVNKRDFPLLTTNYTEPYYDIWGENKPLISHRYDYYLPILSMSKTDAFADILIPTHEDWARVCEMEGKFYVDSRVGEVKQEESNFKSKIPIAIFRGSSTGDGFTIETNQRLKISHLSSLKKKDKDGLPFLDCGITKWNSRCKKLRNSTKLQVIDPSTFSFGLVNFMTLEEQKKYKYIVHIDGHVSAFRLSTMLGLNCCLLIVNSKWKVWYSDMLKPYEHYIPIKEDLSDLYEQIEWCKNNDDSCEYIANNAVEFASKYLGKEGLFDYGAKVLVELKNFMNVNDDVEVEVVSEKETKEPYDSNNNEEIVIEEEVFSNRNVNVVRYGSVVKKIPTTHKKHKYCFEVLNKLADKYPNFCRTFGVEEKDNALVMEFVDGIKFYDYLQDKNKFNFRVYLDVIYELSMCLEMCQRDCLFVHNDLTSWNIILKDKTPVIIDYDKSHVIDDDFIHRGSVNQYKFSSIQDILSLIFTTLYQIITNHTLNPFEIKSVLTIANFISGTDFCRKKFVSIYELKSYLYAMKKHSSLLYTDKKDLEQLHPQDFCEYLRKNVRHSFKGRCIYTNTNRKEETQTFEFDKYIKWSPKAFMSLVNQIKKEETKEKEEDKNSKYRQANRKTFLYKYPV